MYADDVVLLSKSQTGLQQKFDCLAKFCKDWCLTVNVSKTKALNSNKAGCHISQEFLLMTSTFISQHLKVLFSPGRKISKSTKSLFQTSEGFFVFKPWCEKYLSALIFLIIMIITLNLYYCMVVKYGLHLKLCHSKHFRNNSIDSDEIYSKTLCKKLHSTCIKFYRYILGVHKKSAKFAILAEFGRFSLGFNIISQMLEYWHQLENLDQSFPLLQAAYTAD